MGSDHSPSFSVIVPFRNAASTLPDCLDALADQSYEKREFILVNNNSTDNSATVVQSFQAAHPDCPITLLHETKPGPAAARNRGAQQAAGDWLAFTDADCEPDRNWLADLTAAMAAHPHASAFAGCIRARPSDHIVETFLGLFTLPPNRREQAHHRYTLIEGGFPTANFTVHAGQFRAMGGFDERFTSAAGEDHDLCRRLYERQGTIIALNGAVIRHHHRGSLKGLVRQAFLFGGCHAMLLSQTHPGIVIMQAPGVHYLRTRTRRHFWIDLNQADKKMVACVLMAGVIPFGWCLIPLYYLYLTGSILRQASRRAVRLKPVALPIVAGLLLIKSAALTCGRVRGSIRHRVLCF